MKLSRFGTTLKGGSKLKSKRRRRAIPLDADERTDPFDWTSASDADADDAFADADEPSVDYDLTSLLDLSDLSHLSDLTEFGGFGEAEASELLGVRGGHLVNMLSTPDNCLSRSVLEIWPADANFSDVDEQRILFDVNEGLQRKSVPFGFTFLAPDLVVKYGVKNKKEVEIYSVIISYKSYAA